MHLLYSFPSINHACRSLHAQITHPTRKSTTHKTAPAAPTTTPNTASTTTSTAAKTAATAEVPAWAGAPGPAKEIPTSFHPKCHSN
ncbi:uncharacterized protein PGTG_11804 [Puccinia graminis f. sp. tritici CRL 75-36-700-3]|uniref:Uncharacterized protein n=1 Tax=Puccinia graminis f. sp. tritici (strain CRL 75-36-700-3 / race SCCL) TaxID=418459 RepID=E3KMC3_PUCGT|nr:uncharacterized protein PGTG_11804 [Puccinia graminis f. sp. tritici CRL 75-36-700-3]EFP85448.2 hypothetical protein PGTG_11804 [Puccinia graminis f. sp. tritici CRL 75-36-700-3]